MESSTNSASLRYGGLAPAIALAIGIVGANSFADAAGFPVPSQHEETILLRILCGFVLFILSWMLLRFLLQLGFQVATRLSQTRERPGLVISITLLACGTLCVLGALSVIWHSESGNLSMSPEMNFPGNLGGVNMTPPRVDVSMRIAGSLMRPLTVSAALVIGALLLALGVWSALDPAAAAEENRSSSV